MTVARSSRAACASRRANLVVFRSQGVRRGVPHSPLGDGLCLHQFLQSFRAARARVHARVVAIRRRAPPKPDTTRTCQRSLVRSVTWSAPARHDQGLTRAGLTLLGVNAFNLLPLVPLDGGRLFELVLFGRHPVLESGFRACGVAGLGALALWMHDLVLGVLAVLVAVGGLVARRFRRVRESLREAVSPDVPPAAFARGRGGALRGRAGGARCPQDGGAVRWSDQARSARPDDAPAARWVAHAAPRMARLAHGFSADGLPGWCYLVSASSRSS